MVADEDFDAIDTAIADVQDRLDTCRRAEAASRAASIAGFVVLALVLTVATAYRTPVIVFGAITAILSGLIWLGANRSTRLELEDDLVVLDARKAKLIDQVAARNGWRDLTQSVH